MLLLLTHNPVNETTYGILTRDDIITETENRLGPCPLLLPIETLNALLIKTLREFNTWKGLRVFVFVPLSSRDGKFTIPNELQTVLRVDPVERGAFTTDESLILGVTLLPTNTSRVMDYAYTQEWYKEYQRYYGFDFNYRRNGREVFFSGLPHDASGVIITGLSPLDPNNGLPPDPTNFRIEDEFAQRWVLNYFEALVRIQTGQLLRRGVIIEASTDAAQMIAEGEAMRDAMMKELKAHALLTAGRR